MIGLTYTLTSKSGDEIALNDHTTDPSRILALQAYPQFDVDIKNNEITREGQHGVWDFYSYYGRRQIGFQGIMIGDTEEDVLAMKNALLKVLSFPLQPVEGDDGYIYLRWTDLDANDWEVECKLMNSVQFNRPVGVPYRLDFNFSLKASDPFIYGQAVLNQVGIRSYETHGAEFPIVLPAIIGSSVVNILTVDNIGLVDAHTIIRLYGESEGAITNPTVTNLTTGKTMTIEHTLGNEDEWIEIDSRLGTVVDELGNDISADLSGESEFIVLKPGENEIAYSSDEDPATTLYFPSALFSVAYRSTKI